MDEPNAMNATRVSYTLESSLESVGKVEQAATEAAAKLGFDPNECGHIGMSIREATINAIVHGNRYDPAKHVTVSLESTTSALSITVRDQGSGLDPSTIPDPLAPENLLKPSGRGVFLIRSFMDEIRFQNASPGTEVVMIKFVRGAAGHDRNKENKQ
jgi:serine/threonine-protein kinase RsbW